MGRIIRSGRDRRRGAATVELAVCLPVLVLIVFGGIEASHMVFIRQTLTQAAYAGVRSGIDKDAKSSEVNAAAEAVLATRNIQGAQVAIRPGPVELVRRGDPITVEIKAPCNSNSVGPSWFFRDQELAATVTMVKE